MVPNRTGQIWSSNLLGTILIVGLDSNGFSGFLHKRLWLESGNHIGINSGDIDNFPEEYITYSRFWTKIL